MMTGITNSAGRRPGSAFRLAPKLLAVIGMLGLMAGGIAVTR